MASFSCSSWLLVFLCSTTLFLQLCSAGGAVYKVGDAAGWTTVGGVDYHKWATNISFHVGDTVSFVYNNQYHNVLQVTYDAYKKCITTNPIATHSSGNDSFVVPGYGHHFFICGFPGHCKAGQKVDINAIIPNAATPPGSASHPAAHPPAVVVQVVPPAPAPNVAAPRFVSNGVFMKLALAVTIVVGALV